MREIIVNGGAEQTQAWLFAGFGAYSTLSANNGTRSLKVESFKSSIGVPPPDDNSIVRQRDLRLEFGATYTPTFAVNLYTSNGTSNLFLDFDVGDGVYAPFATATMASFGPYWKLWKPGTFVALGTVGRIRFRTVTLPADGLVTWLVDDVSVLGDVMAIKLAERAVDAVVTQLQSSLGTELGLIDTDRADGVTLTVPPNDAYYNHPRSEIAGTHDVVVEVFENSFDFTNPRTDPASQRAWYTIPITVRITCFGRNGESADTMTDRGRRYGTGAFNVFNKNYRLGGTDAAVKHILVNSYTPYWESEGEDENMVLKHQVTLQTEVRCEETQI